MSSIFTAFQQGGAQVTREYGGLGLGLAISKGIVELHGGKLSAHSEGVGRGAKFTLELSLAPPAESARGAAKHSGDVGFTKRQGAESLRILLVEDHADTAYLTERFLANLGYEVHIASTVGEALSVYSSGRFDLIISDLGLPDGSGNDLIRQISRHNSVKAIALSGYGMGEDVRAAKEAGFTGYLIKPINFEQLAVTVLTLLKRETSK